jgi:hypothetical protein
MTPDGTIEKVTAGVLVGIIGWLYRALSKRLLAYYHAQSRMREAVIVLLDERRRELWNRIAVTSSGTDSEQAASFAALLARKDRIDAIRDAEWKAAGCPRVPHLRGLE